MGGYVSPGHNILASFQNLALPPVSSFGTRLQSWAAPLRLPHSTSSFWASFWSLAAKVWRCELIVYLHTLWSPKGNIRCSRQSQLCNMICLVQLQAIQMHPGPNSSGVASTQLCNMICLVQLQVMHSGPNPKESTVLNCVIWSALYNFRQYRCIQYSTV